MKTYQEIIKTILDESGRVADPRHIEAYMRLEYGTLDHLSKEAFNREVYFCCECIGMDGVDNAESLAKSYAL